MSRSVPLALLLALLALPGCDDGAPAVEAPGAGADLEVPSGAPGDEADAPRAEAPARTRGIVTDPVQPEVEKAPARSATPSRSALGGSMTPDLVVTEFEGLVEDEERSFSPFRD